MILLNSSRDTASLFTFIILVSLVGQLYMYLIGATAALRNTRGVAGRVLVVLGLTFVLFAFYGSRLEANGWGLLLIAIALGGASSDPLRACEEVSTGTTC